MQFQTLLFFLFSTVLVGSALRVITSRNPVHAVLFLVLAFFTAAMLWMLLRAEFLAIALVLVYVGAVMVLFLFVVMMLDLNLDKLREGFLRYLPGALFVGVIMAVEMALVLLKVFKVPETTLLAPSPDYNNTKAIGSVLYTEYAFPFEIAALVLLVAIVAGIALTLRQRKDAKAQNAAKQIKVKSQDRLRLIKIPATVRQTEPSSTPGGKA